MSENVNENQNEMEITTLKLTKSQRIRIVNTSELHKVLAQILKRENIINREKEHFWFIGFNSQNYILCVDTVSLGTVTSTQISPMNVFRNGVLKGCTHAILAHNHPSGVLEPSENDIETTSMLYQCGEILNIPIKDHLIITIETYICFTDRKLMAKIEKSTKHLPQFKLIQRWKKEALEIRAKALEEGKLEGLKEGMEEGLFIGEEKGLEEGEKIGIELGKIEEKIAMAKSMLADIVKTLENIT